MEWTVSIDDNLFARVSKIASARGKTTEDLIRECLEKLAKDDEIDELDRLSGTGHSNGWRFNRDEIYERKP